jgi:hypothetical protein
MFCEQLEQIAQAVSFEDTWQVSGFVAELFYRYE